MKVKKFNEGTMDNLTRSLLSTISYFRDLGKEFPKSWLLTNWDDLYDSVFMFGTAERLEIAENMLDSKFNMFDTNNETEVKLFDKLSKAVQEASAELANAAVEGVIRTTCPECGRLNRVKVVFPALNKPFETTTYTCVNCKAEAVVRDTHEYNDDGTLKEDLADLTEDAKSQYVIVGVRDDGIRMLWNASTSKFVMDADDATIYDNQDDARDEWFNVPRKGFRRIFVPVYDPEVMKKLNEDVEETILTKELIDEIDAYLLGKGVHHRVDVQKDNYYEDCLVCSIYDGDWKHDHIAVDWCVHEFFENHPTLKINSKWTENYIGSDGDWYSAEHWWEIVRR